MNSKVLKLLCCKYRVYLLITMRYFQVYSTYIDKIRRNEPCRFGYNAYAFTNITKG